MVKKALSRYFQECMGWFKRGKEGIFGQKGAKTFG